MPSPDGLRFAMDFHLPLTALEESGVALLHTDRGLHRSFRRSGYPVAQQTVSLEGHQRIGLPAGSDIFAAAVAAPLQGTNSQ